MSNYEIIPVSIGDVSETDLIASGNASIIDSFEALEFEFDESVDKASRIDYGVAAGSGLITGLLSVLLGKPLSIEEASKVGGKEADRIVVGIARSLGCKLPNDKVSSARTEDATPRHWPRRSSFWKTSSRFPRTS